MKGILIFCLTCILSTHAMIRSFDGQSAESILAPNHHYLYGTPMFSFNETPAGKDAPLIRASLTFTREKIDKEGFFEVFLYPSVRENLFGEEIDKDSFQLCCTQALFEKNLCENREIGEVIRRPDPDIHSYRAEFELGNDTAVLEFMLHSDEIVTGIYRLRISNCPGNQLGTLTYSGDAVWRNPYGYLPGDVYGRLPFLGILALFYVLITLVYLVLCLKYKKILMTLQWGICAVLGFTTLEAASWFFYLVGINQSGYYSTSGLLLVVLFTNVKETILRVLILLVTMGLGVVKWTLGQTRVKIIVLASFYLFFGFLNQTIIEIETLSEKDLVSQWVNIFVVVPFAILNMGFIYWIILSLIRTIQQLALRHQTLKLQMYKHFFAVLTVAGVLTALFVIYKFYLSVTLTQVHWQFKWSLKSIPDVIAFSVLVGIAVLWRPRSNNTRYGYGEFFQEDEDESGEDENIHQIPLETVSMISGGELTQRKKGPSSVTPSLSSSAKDTYESDREKNIEKTKLKLTEFDKDIIAIDLSDDGDEGEVTIETQLRKMQ